MDRRRAIGSMVVLGAGAVGIRSAWGHAHELRPPDLARLAAHLALIGGMAETILPATETPGAIEAGVPEFIVKMVRGATDRRSQRNFLEGLDKTESICRERFGRPFTECSAGERNAVLRYWESSGPRSGRLARLRRLWSGRRFYDLLRTYTVIGYCTSEAGATRGLAYDFIPGPRFRGCVPLEPGQRAWATF